MLKFRNDVKKILSEITHKNLFRLHQKNKGFGYTDEAKALYESYYSKKENIQEKIEEAYASLILGPLNLLIEDEDLEDLILVDLNKDSEKEYIGISDFNIVNSNNDIIIKFKFFDLFTNNQMKNFSTFKYLYTKEHVKGSDILINGFEKSFFYKNKLKSKFDGYMLNQQKESILKLCDIIKHINLDLTFNIEFFDVESDYHLSKVFLPVISMFVQGNSYPKTSVISEIYNEDPHQMLFLSLQKHLKEKFEVNDHIELKALVDNAEKINKLLKDNNLNTVGFEISEKSHLYTKTCRCVIVKDTVFDKNADLIIPFSNEVNVHNLLNNKMHLIVKFKDSNSEFSATLSEYIEHPKEILEYIYLNGY